MKANSPRTGRTAAGVRRLAGALLVGAGALTAAGAQELPERGDPGLRDPRVPDTVPHISGMWQVRGYSPFTRPADGSPPPFQEWTQEVSEQYLAAEEAGTPLHDPNAECLPSGLPRVVNAPYPTEIIQTPDKMVILNESKHTVRIVHMDAEHPDDAPLTFNGHSVGHWEDDTLVIDTVGLTDVSHLDERGTRHSDQMRIVERLTMLDDETLQWRYTIDDPGAYTEPWTAERVFAWRPELRFLEYICEENNRNQPNEDGVLSDF